MICSAADYQGYITRVVRDIQLLGTMVCSWCIAALSRARNMVLGFFGVGCSCTVEISRNHYLIAGGKAFPLVLRLLFMA